MPTPPDLRFRVAGTDDLETLLALYRQLTPADDPLPSRQRVREVWETILRTPHLSVLVAEAQDKVLASCTLVVVPNLTRGTRPYALIEHVVTDAENRGRGIGKALMTHALDRAWSQNCYKVMLLTSRAAVTGFYEKVGFQRGIKYGFVAYGPAGRP